MYKSADFTLWHFDPHKSVDVIICLQNEWSYIVSLTSQTWLQGTEDGDPFIQSFSWEVFLFKKFF